MPMRIRTARSARLGLTIVCLAAVGCGSSSQDGPESPCVKNLLRIGLALHEHHDTVGSFPKAAISNKEGRPGLSWRVAILPYLGEKTLYEKFKLDESWDSPHNRQLLAQMPAVYDCPRASRGDSTLTVYQAFTGHGAFLEPAYDKTVEQVWWTGDDGVKHYRGEPQGGNSIAAFTDGPMNTLMVVEAKQGVPWTKPEDLPFDRDKPTNSLLGVGSSHPGGFHVVFVDASVWFLPNTMAPSMFRALITRSGDEVVSLDRPTMYKTGPQQPAAPPVSSSDPERIIHK